MNADAFPTFRRFFRFVWRCLRRLRRIFLSRRSAVVYVCLISLGWLALTIDRWHGRRAWAAEKARLAAAGETLDLRELLPNRPPDEENFFAIPELTALRKPAVPLGADNSLSMWFARKYVTVAKNKRGRALRERIASIGGFLNMPLAEVCAEFRKTGMLPAHPLDPDPAKELLQSARQWQSLFEALYSATARPSSMMLPSPAERRIEDLSPDSMSLRHATIEPARGIALHTRAAIANGDMDLAGQDMLVLAKFEQGQAIESELVGLLISAMQRRWQVELLRQGINKHGWTIPHLNEFIAQCEVSAALPLIQAAIGSERIENCRRWEKCDSRDLQVIVVKARVLEDISLKNAYLKFAPDGPFLRHCAALSQMHSDLIAGLSGPPPEQGWAVRMRALEMQRDPQVFQFWFGEGIMPLFYKFWDSRRFFLIACFLEKHFLMHGRYPASLSEIEPSLPPGTLPDTDGQPLRYQPGPDGRTFRLWSVGWNGVDDSANPKKSDDVVFEVK